MKKRGRKASLFSTIRKIKSDIVSGLATAMFSIPEGMAYAKLAGVNPIYGLYSGMIATMTAALTTGTVLMISTLTSAIAISTRSVLDLAGIESQHLSSGLFTLTFLVGVVMFVLGVLRLGKIVNFVSNAVMTGFVVGASMLIIVGELGDLVGISVDGASRIDMIMNWAAQVSLWDVTTASVGFGTISLMILFQMIPKLKEFSTLMVLLIVTLVVNFNKWETVTLIRDISMIPGLLPSLVIPDFTLVPRLALGAVSIVLVALTQGAGVSSAIGNPDGSEPSHSRDFIGEGLGNLAGSFFQSMATGGSLSRTGISIGTGAQSRLAGVFSGIWLIIIIYFLGRAIEHIPIATIAGILCVVAGRIIMGKFSDIKLILTTSMASSTVMIATFLSAFFIPLQWTIFLGAALSLLAFAYTSSTQIRLVQWVQRKDGYFEKDEVPKKLSSHQLMILDYEGNCFFGEVPAIKHHMPSIKNVHGSVIIWRMRGCEDVHSTFLKWLKRFVDEFHEGGNQFMLEGVEEHVMKQLEKSSIISSIGRDNVFPAQPGIFVTLTSVIQTAEKWIEEHRIYD